MSDSKSNDYPGLIDAFEQLKSLWWAKLTTPLEEENSIKEQLKLLKEKTKKLTNLRDTKKENLSRYIDETREQRE